MTALPHIALTPEQTADLKRLLLQHRTLLELAVSRELHAEDALQASIASASDGLGVTAGGESDALIARVERDTQELEATRVALDKIAAGRYGVCEVCAADVGFPRLLVYPGARRCLSCQERAEALRHAPARD